MKRTTTGKNSSGWLEGTICEDEMRFKPTGISATDYGTGIVLNVGVPVIYAKQIESLVGDFRPDNEYELKQYRQKRSLSSNAYAWVLCDKLADKLRTTKEEVYRQAVAQVGVFEEIKVTSPEAGQRFKRVWQHNGLGWLTKTIDDTTILAYYGSSTYDTKQMARLIDYLQDECKEQGIETRPQWEVDAMLTEWDKRG